jgi:hypothetical protein|tara:strand:- start:81 stop:185 length:105 start_codon:yes stop_codon:yes gene_type:complete
MIEPIDTKKVKEWFTKSSVPNWAIVVIVVIWIIA